MKNVTFIYVFVEGYKL